jgi:hypothetical protein
MRAPAADGEPSNKIGTATVRPLMTWALAVVGALWLLLALLSAGAPTFAALAYKYLVVLVAIGGLSAPLSLLFRRPHSAAGESRVFATIVTLSAAPSVTMNLQPLLADSVLRVSVLWGLWNDFALLGTLALALAVPLGIIWLFRVAVDPARSGRSVRQALAGGAFLLAGAHGMVVHVASKTWVTKW